jgi:uncharacterized protein YfbU (UPF0304 family)
VNEMTLKSERFEMRLDTETIESIDQWRAKQDDHPSRAEAIRRLVDAGLGQVRLSDGEKLIISMLGDFIKKSKINTDINPEFVTSSISGGHFWALKWEFPGIFHDHSDNKSTVTEVVNVLDMWSFLEDGFSTLNASEKNQLAAEISPLGQDVKFIGFDGNNESEHLGIARHLIEEMDRFHLFKGRSLNSHCPVTPRYRKMLLVFDPIRPSLVGRKLNASEIISIMKAG